METWVGMSFLPYPIYNTSLIVWFFITCTHMNWKTNYRLFTLSSKKKYKHWSAGANRNHYRNSKCIIHKIILHFGINSCEFNTSPSIPVQIKTYKLFNYLSKLLVKFVNRKTEKQNLVLIKKSFRSSNYIKPQ